MKNDFQPDYTNLLKVLYNQQPDYLPLYEHNIDEPFIAKMLGREVDSTGKSGADLEEHYRVVTEFWRANTYDALSYEAKICEIYPDHGAILGGRLGPIQTRADFDRYPWEEIPRIFIRAYKPHLDALRKVMPRGMKAYGGCGYGIFESAEDLVGYESLCMMQFLDPDLFRDLFVRIGDLYEVLWTWVLDNYADLFVFCRMGDDLGYRTFVLQGGEDPKVSLVDIVGALRARFSDCAITVSAGELPREVYQQLFDAGAARYLLRHETAAPRLYGKLHPASMSLEERKACLFTLSEIGFQEGSGFLVGAPGQTTESMAANFAFLHELDPHMIGIGPFIPHSSTPFASKPPATMEETLFLLACLRLAHPRALLPATTARATIDPKGRMAGLEAGANVIMPNLTPASYRGDYALYNNKLATGLEAVEQHDELEAILSAQGYSVESSRGDSLVV